MKFVIDDGMDRIEVEGYEQGVMVSTFDGSNGDPDPVQILLNAQQVTDLSFAINQAKSKIRKDKT